MDFNDIENIGSPILRFLGFLVAAVIAAYVVAFVRSRLKPNLRISRWMIFRDETFRFKVGNLGRIPITDLKVVEFKIQRKTGPKLSMHFEDLDVSRGEGGRLEPIGKEMSTNLIVSCRCQDGMDKLRAKEGRRIKVKLKFKHAGWISEGVGEKYKFFPPHKVKDGKKFEFEPDSLDIRRKSRKKTNKTKRRKGPSNKGG